MLASFVLAVCFQAFTQAADWEYDGPYGTEAWNKVEPNCMGSSQSPVDIDLSNLHYKEELKKDSFVFNGYDHAKEQNITLDNSGHSVQLLFGGTQRFIRGGGLPGRYDLLQIHFHWGSDNSRGSEHTKNGRSYPMEMHAVHTKYGLSVDEALRAKEGLAVLGVFFEIHEYDNPKLEQLLQYFNKVIFEGQSVTIQSFPLKSLLPHNLGHFYRYDGSLTTPGCYESVIWTVFNETIHISKDQMTKFRMLREDKPGVTSNADYMYNNYRPVQKLHGRKLYTTDRSQDKTIGPIIGAGTTLSSVSWIVSLLAFGIYLCVQN